MESFIAYLALLIPEGEFNIMDSSSMAMLKRREERGQSWRVPLVSRMSGDMKSGVTRWATAESYIF